MATVGETLKAVRTERGLSQKALARLAGITSSYIVLLEANKRQHVSWSTAVKLATILRVEAGIFLRDDSLLTLSHRPPEAIIAELQQSLQHIQVIELPICGPVPAGYPETKEQEIEGYVSVPKNELANTKRGLYALRVNGDSLEGDGINDGDIVVVEPDPDIIECKIYIIMLQNQVVARHLQKVRGRYKLLSSNNKYKVIDPDEIDIQGRVILSGRWRKH